MVLLVVGFVILAAGRLPQPEALAAAWLGSLLVAPHIYISDYLLALPACLILARLGRLCFVASLLLLFPVTPALMPYSEAFLLVTPLLALVCLTGAAVSPCCYVCLRHRSA